MSFDLFQRILGRLFPGRAERGAGALALAPAPALASAPAPAPARPSPPARPRPSGRLIRAPRRAAPSAAEVASPSSSETRGRPWPEGLEESFSAYAAADAELSGALRTDLNRRLEVLGARLRGVEPDLVSLLERLAGEEIAETIPQIPAAAQRALSLTLDLETPTGQLVSVFEGDPSLTQALLKSANSVYYGASESCSSIRSGIVRLGRKALRNVLLTQVLTGLVCRPGRAFGRMPEEVWEHLSASAPLARRIAPAFNADPEEAFAIALLHDVGKLVFFEAAAAARRKERRELSLADMDSLSLCLDVLHEPLGGLAMERWKLGERAVRLVGTHHRRRAGAADRFPLGEAIFVADRVQLAERGGSVDLDQLWLRGRLNGSEVRTAELLEVHYGEEA